MSEVGILGWIVAGIALAACAYLNILLRRAWAREDGYSDMMDKLFAMLPTGSDSP